jgi:hypothetical protein
MWHYSFPLVSNENEEPFSLDSNDGDSQQLAPLPAYDRVWRHPSEAADEERQRHLSNTPPPLSRRLAMTVAVISAAASLVVLIIVVPHGMKQYAEPQSATTTSVNVSSAARARIKGALATMKSGASLVSALAVTTQDLIAPIDQVGSSNSLSVTLPNGKTVDASVIARDEQTGLAVVEVNSGSPGIKAIKELNDTSMAILSDDDLDIVDATADTVVTAKVGLATSSDGVSLPLDIRKSIRNIAAVVNSYGQVLGIAVHRNHSTFMLPIEKVVKLINDVRASLNGATTTGS